MDEKKKGRELTHSSCYIKHSLPRSKGKRRRNGKYSTASCRIFSNLNHSHKMRSLSTFLHLLLTTKVQIISVEIVIRYEGWFLSLTQPLQLLLLYICYEIPCVPFDYHEWHNFVFKKLSWIHGYIRYEREKVFCRHGLTCVLFECLFHLFKNHCFREQPVKRIKRSVYSIDPAAYSDII